ncbi:uncharacterized protein EDB91DRAFT_1099341 [Suillus paluster]|uniref:uncharacterized protein n=1 Tax=Suillus paluster TaxID=48578 RepID=UPI001B862934|nr:uncharacterized protein EDB91DRAFT_1099341 [Suillus paluster]KAG1753689.1 hypothetical protein EDB91DRAFT_1099341 [Suillus paluster]
MDDLHEAEFSCTCVHRCLAGPMADASDVILTGSFDHWSRSMHLPKGASGFVGNVKVPWSEKIPYKFIVDGKWITRDDRPTELDSAGNLNNVLFTPSKPVPLILEHPSTSTAPKIPNSMTSSTKSPEEPVLYGKTSQQVLEADQRGDSDFTIHVTSAVGDLVVSDKEVLPGAYVPDVIVEAVKTAEFGGDADALHAIVDTASSAVSTVVEEITTALEYVSLGIGSIFHMHGHVPDATEQPSTTSVIGLPVTETSAPESTQGVPSPEIAKTAPQIAPVVPILILPVNDDTLNETASALPEGEIDASGSSAPHPSDATSSVPEPSTHSPILLSKQAPPVIQETQAGENDEPVKEENSEAQAAEKENGELLADAIARPSDAVVNPTTPEIDVNPDLLETAETPAAGAETPAAGAETSTPDNESSLPTPKPQDTPAADPSSMPSTPGLNSDTKDLKDVPPPSSTSTDTPVKSSSKFSTASKKKKRRSLFARLKEFFFHREKKK